MSFAVGDYILFAVAGIIAIGILFWPRGGKTVRQVVQQATGSPPSVGTEIYGAIKRGHEQAQGQRIESALGKAPLDPMIAAFLSALTADPTAPKA